jgi:hypothetical protein
MAPTFARHQNPRKGLSERHPDVGIALVIPELDVERRMVLPDQIPLQQQRLGL